MARFADFMPFVAPHAPGVPDIMVEHAARQAAIEFCQRTLALQRTLDRVNTRAGVGEYDLELPTGEVLARLLSVHVAGRPIDVGRPEDADARPLGEQGIPAFAYSPDGARLMVLSPIPSTAGAAIVVRAALRPSQTASSLDDAIFERHAEAIAHGAVSRLSLLQGSAFANPELAAASRGQFEAAVSRVARAVFYATARSKPRNRPFFF